MGEPHTRARALITLQRHFAPPSGADELAVALLEDLREMLAALRLRVLPDAAPNASTIAAAAGAGPLLALFADVPALPPLAVEAAIDALESADVALGPCADGSLYLLGLRAGLDSGLAGEIAAAALAPGALHALADLCDDAELAVALLPPWFRLASENELSFAESLARLSLMSEEGEEDFVGDRLRLWFEQQT